MQQPQQQRKLFVLDTNVILHDAHCIENFEEHDIAIPITVLEELDRFKRGNEDIHFQARQFLRNLDELSGPGLTDEGISLGPNLGRIRVVLTQSMAAELKDVFFEAQADHRILNATLHLSKDTRYRQVVLVSKDTNIRLKARSLGLAAEDYEADKLQDFDRLYSGKRIVEGAESEEIALFFESDGIVPAELIPRIENPQVNENFIFRNGSKSILLTYQVDQPSSNNKNPAGLGYFCRIDKQSAFGIQPRNAEQTFALRALLDERVSLVTLAGKAGTGKTLLALAAALEHRKWYQQILLARPIVPLSNKDLGFLPGDIDAKLDPYMQPLFDNLNVIRHQFSNQDHHQTEIAQMLETGKLKITPLAYIRGRSLQKTYFIVDEAQNLTPHEVKTIITRAGDGTKIVLTGDLQQIDQPYLDARSNGLSFLINRMVGQSIYAHITLEKGERSKLADIASRLL